MSLEVDFKALFDNCIKVISFNQQNSNLKQKLKKIIKLFLGKKEDKIEYSKWTYGMIASAVYYAGKKYPQLEAVSKNCLVNYFEKFAFTEAPVVHIHDLLSAEVLIKLYEDEIDLSKKDKYLSALKKMVQFATSYQRDSFDNVLYINGLEQKYVFADTIGVLCPFLFKMGIILNDQKLCELAVKQIQNFLKTGFDKNTGLPYHGFVAETGICYGIIGWGRAVGWILRGMSGMISEGCKDSYVISGFESLLTFAFKFQLDSGLFAWQLPAVKGPSDTSATAMILLAVVDSGINGYEENVRAGVNGIRKYLINGEITGSSAECGGFSVYPQRYGAFLWSTGPGLELLSKVED